MSKHNPCLCEYQIVLRARIAREEGEITESLEWLAKALKHNQKSTKYVNKKSFRFNKMRGKDYKKENKKMKNNVFF